MENFLTHLECSVCGDRHSPHELQTVCRSCGKSLLARYDLDSARKGFSRNRLRDLPPSLWKYAPLLPVEQQEHVVSLGEVTTPLVRLTGLEKELGLKELWVKDEAHLPTGSFKARGLSVAVSKAKELGVEKICIPSAGNAGGALAAYAARAGIESHIFVPEDTPVINVKECYAYGAHVELVRGTISDAAKVMNERKSEHADWFDVSTLKEPYRLEGKKTMGYELAEQFDWNLPDTILYPTGGGTGLIGMWKAFEEMEKLGWIGKKRPKMVSVQADGCAPVVKAFEQKKRVSEFWPNAATIASGLRVPKAFADHLILDAVYESGGTAVTASDEEIVLAIKVVAGKDGFFFCPEGAACVVALRKLVQKGFLKSDDVVLLFNTAAGNKYPEVITD
ncbi:MAG: threonine synthase [Ignavibacteriales bacterium]|nr:threonine synthase [Ignavibacteriales bacterium]